MITLICGLPRAGKTTFSKRYDGKCKIIHLDDYGAPIHSYIRVCNILNPKEDIVIEGVYNRADIRKNLIAPYNDEKKICIWLDTPIEIKKTRQGYSKHCEYPFEPPTYAEGWDEIRIIRNGEETIITN